MPNQKTKKTVLIIGAGFAGCTAAYLLKKKGFKATVLEKNEFPGGGCQTQWYGGHPYTLGPRIFFTRDKEVIKLMTSFLKIRQFYNKTWSYVENDRQFYNYPIYQGDFKRMPDYKKIKSQLKEKEKRIPRVNNFESYWLDTVGLNLYSKFIDKYSKKMWGIESNKELSADFKWVNKGNPIRKKDTRIYGDMFQGYPYNKDGYNQFFDRTLKGCKFVPGCNVNSFDPKTKKIKTSKGEFIADIIINTISVDSLFNKVFGVLKYSGRKMLKIVLPIEKILPKDIVWIHYSGNEPFTRVTEFKKITGHKSKDTLIGVEIPISEGQDYPVQVKEEISKFQKYQKIFPKNFYSIGRLGSFSYKGIPEVMRDALETVKTISS